MLTATMHVLERWLDYPPVAAADPAADSARGRGPDGASGPARDTVAAGVPAPVGDPPAADYAAIAHQASIIARRMGRLDAAWNWARPRLVFRHFLSFGTDRQQAACAGRSLAVAISEPEVGAHPKQLTTRAERIGGHWRLQGRKAWVSGGGSADFVIVFAITAEVDGRKRYGAFLVPAGTPGVHWQSMQANGRPVAGHDQMTLDACEVPDAALLGDTANAYERMALPFRDIEDAIGSCVFLGGLRHALGAVDPGHPESLGAIVGLAEVFAAAADTLIGDLDAGRMTRPDGRLVGLLTLAEHLLARVEALPAGPGPSAAPSLAEVLADLRRFLTVARRPRISRQARLGEMIPRTP